MYVGEVFEIIFFVLDVFGDGLCELVFEGGVVGGFFGGGGGGSRGGRGVEVLC